MKGKFITFEGCEGVGKSTQVALLKNYLEETNQDCLFLREPGGNEISEKIRNIILDTKNEGMVPRCEVLLYCAARAQLVNEVIKPALDSGKLVICDRFIDSTFAYQGVAGKLGAELVENLNNCACGDVVPNLTIFLDLSPKEAFARKGGADLNDRMEMKGMEFHNDVYKGYKLAQERHPERIVSFNVLGTKYETQEKIREYLKTNGYIK